MAKKPVSKAAKSTTRRPQAGTRKTVSFPCSVFKQGRYELILFLAEAKELWKLVQVNRLEEDKDEGYQRAASPSRVKKIAEFIGNGNAIPLSVLIAFDDAKLNRDESAILVPNRPDAGWVIDGQHRLAGAHEASVDITLPVVAFLTLDTEDQINFFVTINREQKGVPSSLYYELLQKLPRQKTEREITQERASDLAAALKRDESSPFFSRIVSTTSPRSGQLSTANFVRKLAPYLQRDGRLSVYTDEERKGILDNYYRALQNLRPSEFRKANNIFFKTIGFGAMMNALPRVLDMTITHSGGAFRVSDIVQVLENLPDWDPGAWRQLGTGNAAEKQAADDVITGLQQLRDTEVISSRLKL